jgi:Glycine-rich domain
MAPFDATELGSIGSDGLGMAPRPGEPESNLLPGMAAPRPEIEPLDAESLLGPLVPPNITDTSIQAPQPPGLTLQEPPRWQYDFDPANQLARATFPGEVAFVSGGPIVPVVSSFNTRTGAVTLQTADVAAVLALVAHVTVFTAGGTWTPNPNMLYATLETWGGGGAGGSVPNTSTSNTNVAGGGGAGSYSRATVSKAAAGASQTVTIGPGGTPGAAGNNPGGAGGDTSIGALCIGKGGAGGPTPQSAGGLGGIAGTGDLTSTGMPGTPGITISGSNLGVGGAGGSSAVGGGGQIPASASAAGNPGTGHGSGGSGAFSFNAAGAFAGGPGTAGYAVVTEVCSQ